MSHPTGEDQQDEDEEEAEEDEVYAEQSEDETMLSLKEALTEARAQCGTLSTTQKALIADLKELVDQMIPLLSRKGEPGVMDQLRVLFERRDQHIQWCEQMRKQIAIVNIDLELASETYSRARLKAAERNLAEARVDLVTARMQAEADAARMQSDIDVPD